jgi:hypothetical protein
MGHIYLTKLHPTHLNTFDMNVMFDPTVLDVVLFASAISYGVKLWQNSSTQNYQAQMDASWDRLGAIYMKRGEALLDLARHMEKYPWRISDALEEYEQDLKATGDSINNLCHTIAEMKRVQRQAGDVKIDLDELVEQIGWAEEQQELWLTTIEDLRKRWSVKEPVAIQKPQVEILNNI